MSLWEFLVIRRWWTLVLLTNMAEIIHPLVPCACASFSPLQNNQENRLYLCFLPFDFVTGKQKDHCSQSQESWPISCRQSLSPFWVSVSPSTLTKRVGKVPFKFSPTSIIPWSWVLDEQISVLSPGLTAPSQFCRKLNPGLTVEGAADHHLCTHKPVREKKAGRIGSKAWLLHSAALHNG